MLFPICGRERMTVGSHSCLHCPFLESLENGCPCWGKAPFSEKAMPLRYHVGVWVSGPSGSHCLLMAEVSGQAVFPMRNCRILCWPLCRVHLPWCISFGLCGTCSLTGKTGLAEKKPSRLAPGCTSAPRQLVHMEGFPAESIFFDGKSILLEESSCFWQTYIWSKH